MAARESKKRNFINISSSDESESDSDVDAIDGISSSTSDDDEDYDNEYDDDETDRHYCVTEDDEASIDEDRVNNRDDEESMCNKVIRFIRGGRDLNELKTVECKSYLRNHGLRLSGTKEECLERIQDHWRLKEGNGEAFYPRSSFTIDCTGDVCRGDIVLFNQKVYEKFDKMARHGRQSGRRTVAGRVVKESYGAAKQQHTFTVEVLWCKGAKKLPALYPLLVKGRNLYRMKTHRQHWKNEQERSEVLEEKHRRGAAARTIREMRKSKAATKSNQSKSRKSTKHCKRNHDIGQPGITQGNNLKMRRLNEYQKTCDLGHSGTNQRRNHVKKSYVNEYAKTFNSGTKHWPNTRNHAKKRCVNEYGKALDKDKKWSLYHNFSPYHISNSHAFRRINQNWSQYNQVGEPPYFL